MRPTKLTREERAYVHHVESMGYKVAPNTLKTSRHVGRGGVIVEYITGTWVRATLKRISRKKARKIAYNARVGA